LVGFASGLAEAGGWVGVGLSDASGASLGWWLGGGEDLLVGRARGKEKGRRREEVGVGRGDPNGGRAEDVSLAFGPNKLFMFVG